MRLYKCVVSVHSLICSSKQKTVQHNEQWSGPWVCFPSATTYDCCCLIIWQARDMANRANALHYIWGRMTWRRYKHAVLDAGILGDEVWEQKHMLKCMKGKEITLSNCLLSSFSSCGLTRLETLSQQSGICSGWLPSTLHQPVTPSLKAVHSC